MKDLNKLQPIFRIKVSSPLGILVIESQNNLISSISLPTKCNFSEEVKNPEDTLIPDCLYHAKKQLEEYFGGKRMTFDIPYTVSLPLKHRQILDHLSHIPYGKTTSYGELAKKLGFIRGARQVGHVMAMNPLPIIIPCHRVICANKKLGGYSLGGTHNKEFLLILEHALPIKEVE